MEAKILGADERARHLEYQLFQTLREETLARARRRSSRRPARSRLSTSSVPWRKRPGSSITAGPKLDHSLAALPQKTARHPVLDQNLAEEKFVPNDTDLDGETLRLAIITGPNMAGKSTYIRQVALDRPAGANRQLRPGGERSRSAWSIASSPGSGANDDLSRGQSTFMVEMNETANIVNNATERSLVILDEIGRGTSTFDGLSIAWSVAEFLHDKIRARTLFATHYHELTKARRGAQRRLQLQRRGARMERANHFPAQDRPWRRGQELRHPGRAAGRFAAGNSRIERRISCHIWRNQMVRLRHRTSREEETRPETSSRESRQAAASDSLARLVAREEAAILLSHFLC